MRQYIGTLWMALVLAGCAQAPVTQSPADLGATHGFVHVSLPNSRGLLLRSVASGQEYNVVRQTAHGPYAYGLWLPPGEYEVVGLRNPDGSKYLTVSSNRGRLTDLGGVVRLEIGGYEFMVLPIRHPEIAAETRQATQTLLPYLTTAEPIEWKPLVPPQALKNANPPTGLGLVADLLMDYTRHVNKPSLNQQMKEAKTIDEAFHRALASVPPQTDEPGSDADASLYYGAELGQIRVRKRDGQWVSLDTGTLQAITAVEVNGRSLVAGTARGEIRISEDGKTWQRRFSFAPEESVVDIDRIGSRWIVVTARLTTLVTPYMAPGVTMQSTDLIKVYSTTKEDVSDLALLREIALKEKIFVSRGMGLRGQHTGGIYYLSDGNDLLRLDLQTLQWSSKTPGHRVDGINVAPTTGTLTVYRQQGAFSKLHVSTDQGATWRPADTPPYIFYDVYFESPGNGLATRWNTGAFSATIEFMKYDAAADRWQKTHDAPPGCVRILRDADNVQRFCVTSGNSVLNYVDGKWVVEMAVN